MNSDHSQAICARDLFVGARGETLLAGVDLDAGRGEFIGLTGPNGAGKSTLLRTIAGILRPRRGTVRLEGRDLQSMSAREIAACLAFVPQVLPQTHGFTSLEIVLMGRYPHFGRFQIEGRDDERIARDAMRLTGTLHFADRTLDTLSGGERQRVFVARALAQQPRILLLDEPTSNLDLLHQLKVLDLVRQLVDGGLTVIAAFHDLNVAARYCDRLVLLGSGRVLATGLPEDILTPGTIESALGVRAAVYRDPVTGTPAISLVGPANGDTTTTADFSLAPLRLAKAAELEQQTHPGPFS